MCPSLPQFLQYTLVILGMALPEADMEDELVEPFESGRGFLSVEDLLLSAPCANTRALSSVFSRFGSRVTGRLGSAGSTRSGVLAPVEHRQALIDRFGVKVVAEAILIG